MTQISFLGKLWWHRMSVNPEIQSLYLISKCKFTRKWQQCYELLIAARIQIRHCAKTKSLLWLCRTFLYIYSSFLCCCTILCNKTKVYIQKLFTIDLTSIAMTNIVNNRERDSVLKTEREEKRNKKEMGGPVRFSGF